MSQHVAMVVLKSVTSQLAVNATDAFTNVSEAFSLSKLAVTRASKPILVYAKPTLSPGHAAILEMHENSKSNAIIYIGVVLLLYVLGMSIVLIKYIRTERYEARLTRLFQDLMQRDNFFRVSRRRSSIPKPSPEPPFCAKDELPHSSTLLLQENGEVDVESKF